MPDSIDGNRDSMQGYGADSYGEAFADVYDEWYGTVTDIKSTVALILDLAGAGGRVIELGVGTGRLAFPMAAAGLQVTGIDTSAAMLSVLTARAPAGAVQVVHGDMVTELPDGPFDVALAAYNTLFNLFDEGSQTACFAAVASRLVPGGAFVVEAFVPDHEVQPGSSVEVRSITADRVVLSVSQQLPSEQRASGQFVDISEAGGVRLRPWQVRWASPNQLDEMATRAGFALEHRWADVGRCAFDDDSTHHVSVYRLGPESPDQNE
jgi:SAM-dependent methyltransferase